MMSDGMVIAIIKLSYLLSYYLDDGKGSHTEKLQELYRQVAGSSIKAIEWEKQGAVGGTDARHGLQRKRKGRERKISSLAAFDGLTNTRYGFSYPVMLPEKRHSEALGDERTGYVAR